jgi:hypothetical protein
VIPIIDVLAEGDYLDAGDRRVTFKGAKQNVGRGTTGAALGRK